MKNWIVFKLPTKIFDFTEFAANEEDNSDESKSNEKWSEKNVLGALHFEKYFDFDDSKKTCNLIKLLITLSLS